MEESEHTSSKDTDDTADVIFEDSSSSSCSICESFSLTTIKHVVFVSDMTNKWPRGQTAAVGVTLTQQGYKRKRRRLAQLEELPVWLQISCQHLAHTLNKLMVRLTCDRWFQNTDGIMMMMMLSLTITHVNLFNFLTAVRNCVSTEQC